MPPTLGGIPHGSRVRRLYTEEVLLVPLVQRLMENKARVLKRAMG